MLFRLWWWMRTGRDLVCPQLPGTIGKMSTSKQLLIARQYGVAGALERHEREHKLGYHTMAEPLKLHRIRDYKIPKKTTHAYQPADQFIITMVKACVCRGWDAWVEDIFARNSNDTAIAEMSVSHMPTLRKRKYALLAGARDITPFATVPNITKKN